MQSKEQYYQYNNKEMLKQSTLAFVSKQSNDQYIVYKLGELIPTFPSASNSVVLSLAAYITWKFPYLPHPNYMNFQLKQIETSQSFETQDLSLHPLYEVWSDLLCQCIFDQNAIRVGTVLYVIIPVESSYIQQLQKFNWSYQVFKQVNIKQIFNLQTVFQVNKNILLLNFAISQLRDNHLPPKVNVPALILGTLFNNEKWSIYHILKGEKPKYQEFLTADAVILPGSSLSVLDSVPQIDSIVIQLKNAFKENQKLKILAICFGHQLISKMFGAKVVKKTRFQGHEFVKFRYQDCLKYPFLRNITDNIEKQFIMPEHHEDYVETIPQGFQLIADSDSCRVESLVKKDGRILSFQFHPEYFSEYAKSFTNRVYYHKTHYHAHFGLQIEKQKKKSHHQSCTRVRTCMRQFLSN